VEPQAAHRRQVSSSITALGDHPIDKPSHQKMPHPITSVIAWRAIKPPARDHIGKNRRQPGGASTLSARSAHFLTPLVAGGQTSSVLQNLRTGVPLARHLEPAFDSKSRRRGLLGRHSLLADTALIIAPCKSVHTFFMRFTIDVVFVDRSGTVVKCCRLKPWRIAFARRAFATVELAAGGVDAAGLLVGDRLVVEAHVAS
jgi:uncharacterized membrane protein (UPF0127 family)